MFSSNNEFVVIGTLFGVKQDAQEQPGYMSGMW